MSWLFEELTFLVIDDSGFTRKIVRNALSTYGAKNVVEAVDAVEGLKILRDGTRAIDFILVDQEMPVLDGTQFTRLVRADKSLPDPTVPIVMVTGFGDKAHVVEAREAGVNGFVVKPFSPEELHDHILGVLEGGTGRAPKPPEAEPETELARKAGGLSDLTYLVIDDSGFARKMVRKILLQIGARHVIEAEDGVAGLAILRDRSVTVDVVLVDREMPLLDGFDFTRIVRRDTTLGNPKVPVVMITANVDENSVVTAKNAGVSAFLAKPFSAGDLLHHIDFAVNDPRPFIAAKRYVGPDRRYGREGEGGETPADDGVEQDRRTQDADIWEI